MGIFKSCADLGDSIMKFIRKGKANAVIIGLLFFISPVNIIMWLLMLCAIYRGKKR